MPDSIQSVEDLKKAYPELCEKIFEEGVHRATDVSQKFVQQGIEKSLEIISTLLLQFHKDIGHAMLRAFLYDPAAQGDSQFLQWLAEQGIDLEEYGLNNIN